MTPKPLLALALAIVLPGSALAQSRDPFTIVETGESFGSLQDAVASIGDGDGTIRIAPGRYRDCAVQEGGRVAFVAETRGTAIFDGGICEGKAVLVLRGRASFVDGLVFTPDANYAGSAASVELLTGDRVGFKDEPDLRLAAHEAAHVVQQRRGVQLKGDVGRPGDPYERQADRAAEAVVAGKPAEGILDENPGQAAPHVQKACDCGGSGCAACQAEEAPVQAELEVNATRLFEPGVFAEELERRPPTPRLTEGPFYPDRLPLDTDNDLLVIHDAITPAVGEVTHLGGRILDAYGDPVRNALVEIWQVDHNGAYIHSGSANANQRDANFQGYGRFLTGSRGEYYFRTVKPVTYPGRVPLDPASNQPWLYRPHGQPDVPDRQQPFIWSGKAPAGPVNPIPGTDNSGLRQDSLFVIEPVE